MLRPRAAAFVFALGLCAALGDACAQDALRIEHYIAPPVGFTWTSVLRDSGSFGSGETRETTTVGERSWQGMRVMSFESPSATILSTADGGWLARLDARGGAVMRWDPPMSFDFPIHVGKTWSRTVRMTDAQDATTTYTDHCRAVAEEQVTVAAGSFTAFRIDCSNTLGVELQAWWVPELGIWAKSIMTRTPASGREGRREIELMSYAQRQ
jgi:hypothetical protein